MGSSNFEPSYDPKEYFALSNFYGPPVMTLTSANYEALLNFKTTSQPSTSTTIMDQIGNPTILSLNHHLDSE